LVTHGSLEISKEIEVPLRIPKGSKRSSSFGHPDLINEILIRGLIPPPPFGHPDLINEIDSD